MENTKNNNVTELVFILDKSGSMVGMEKDTVGGFNSMIKKQRNIDGTVYVSTILFADESQVLHDRKDIKEIKDLTENDYHPCGCTALLDAIGDAINRIGIIHKYARPEDVPSHTIFAITTDGEENASVKYTSKQVKEMIRDQQEKHGWEFLFLAANIDAVEAADNIGIRRERAVNYSVKEETSDMYEVLCDAVDCLRKDNQRELDLEKKFREKLRERKAAKNTSDDKK